MIHYIPNKDFLIRRHLFNKSQDRNPFFERKLKRKYNAKSNNYSVQKAILQLESEYFSSEEELEDEDIIEKPLEGLEMNLSEKLMFQKPFPESEDNFIIKNEKDFEDFEERNILSKKYKSLVQFPRQKTNENEINTKEFKTRQFLKKKTAILIKNEEIKEKMKEQEKAVEVEKSTEKNKSSLYEEIEIKPLELDGLFNYEFETLRSYNHFFPHNNVKNIIEKIILRQLCLDSPFSVRSRKGRLEKKLRSSKIKFEKLENSKKK